MKKNTMQSLADALGVSRITVWKALNHKEGVSEEIRKKIIDRTLLAMDWISSSDPKI